jgi:hypothetical protein
MTDPNTIEVAARELWRSDPRVNQALWAQGDPQLRSMYLILACVTLNAAERNKKVGEGPGSSASYSAPCGPAGHLRS